MDGLAALQGGPDLIGRTNAVGLKRHDQAPIVVQTASSGL